VKAPEREFDIFTKQEGSWKFSERIKATSVDDAKMRYLSDNRKASSWDVTAYPRK
jgi:hypothetical protein